MLCYALSVEITVSLFCLCGVWRFRLNAGGNDGLNAGPTARMGGFDTSTGAKYGNFAALVFVFNLVVGVGKSAHTFVVCFLCGERNINSS